MKINFISAPLKHMINCNTKIEDLVEVIKEKSIILQNFKNQNSLFSVHYSNRISINEQGITNSEVFS
ncbi:MAG: hypothetical protein A2W30_08545 [Ignavibacteria bacterium RBG_16_36_9]|nr:MAG: hypothetical protein A2W30_08545 [Ignavibacteria bacterium RBG_16_36_9]